MKKIIDNYTKSNRIYLENTFSMFNRETGMVIL